MSDFVDVMDFQADDSDCVQAHPCRTAPIPAREDL